MNPIVKNVLAVIAGSLLGMAANMAVLMIGMALIPLPEGASIENLDAAIPMFELKHFITPFVAHAMNAFVGAFVAYKIAANNKMTVAMITGALVLVAGILNVIELPSTPTWFVVVDLVLAYIPVAWLGGKLAQGKTQTSE
jgi:hypothetical protein